MTFVDQPIRAPGRGRLAARFLPVLAYHSFAGAERRRDELHTSLDALDEHLSVIRAAGFQVLGLTAALQSSRPTVALTVDDGYTDFLGAADIIERHMAKATLYVPAGYLGAKAAWLAGSDARRGLLGAGDLRELADRGVEIGAHGWAHRALDLLGPMKLAEETRTARRRLEQELGVPIDSFAYPFGYAGRRARLAVIDAGYQNACVLGHSLHRRAGDSYSIHRLLVKSSDGGPRLLRRIRTEFVSPRTVMTSALRLPWRGYRSLTTARECR